MDVDDGLNTARVPLGGIRESGQLPARNEVAREPEVSVTQAIRVRRSRRRAPGNLSGSYVAPVSVRPVVDAAFPATVSLLFTGPLAVRMWGDGHGAIALTLVVAVFAIALGGFMGISRTLDRRA